MFTPHAPASTRRPRRSLLSLALAAVLCLVGCQRGTGNESSPAPEEGAAADRLVVVATTTMLADLVSQLGGNAVEVHGLLSPGADPHLYQPTPSDARRIASADLVVTSGLGLEGWVDDLIDGAGGDAARVVASADVEGLHHPDYPGASDPHFWFDLERWATAARTVGDALAAQVPADQAAGVRQRLGAYVEATEALDDWAEAQIASIPESHRTLVTSHDAFHYFGERYGLTVTGLQGITTEQQPSQRDVARIVEAVRATGVPAVFVETSVNPTMVRRVAEEASVAVAGPLYSDSIGTPDSAAATFIGTFSENVRMIVEALGGAYEPPPAS